MATARLAVVIALVTGLVLAAALFYPAERAAPAVTFTLIDGTRMPLAELRGAPALITFWATTCPPCIEELPELSGLYRELAPRGFRMVAVAVRDDPPAQVLEMKNRKDLPYPIALDLDGAAAKAFDVQFIPRAFLLDSAGNIVQKMTGKVAMAELHGQIENLLEQKK